MNINAYHFRSFSIFIFYSEALSASLYGFKSRLTKGQGLVRAYLIPVLIESVTSCCLCSCEECRTEGGRGLQESMTFGTGEHGRHSVNS